MVVGGVLKSVFFSVRISFGVKKAFQNAVLWRIMVII